MRSPIARLLALVCGLLLALPPEWCCAAVCGRRPGAEPCPPNPKKTCGCCGCSDQPACPAPTPTPATPAPGGCCVCVKSDSTAPDGPKPFAPDLSLSTPLADPTVPTRSAGASADCGDGPPGG